MPRPMMRRPPCFARRPVPPIRRAVWRIRTFHGDGRAVMDGVRQPFTLDRIVRVTLAHLAWLERVA